MRCKERQVMLYWSGELSGNKQTDMEAHLETCATCRKLLTELEGLQQEFQVLPLVEPDKDLLRVAIEKNAGSTSRWWNFPVLQLRFAAGMLLGLGLLLFYVWTNLSELPSPFRPETTVTMKFRLDVQLTSQMSALQTRVSNVKKRLRSPKPETRQVVPMKTIHKKVMTVRADLQKLKSRITESESFPFQDTYSKHRRKHHENNSFYDYLDTHSDLLAFSEPGICRNSSTLNRGMGGRADGRDGRNGRMGGRAYST